MKPVLGMESGKADVVTVTGMNVPDKVDTHASRGFSSKRVIVGVIAAIVAIAAVAAIVLVSVHFGSKITTESFKVVRQTFKSDNGKVIEEETNVTKTEVDIRIPNIAEVIYDYKNGIVVTRFVNRETTVRSECLAQYMNETRAPSQDPDEYSEEEVEVYENENEESENTEKWVRTKDEVPEEMISENVAKACSGTKIYWLKKVETHGDDVKRQACPLNQRYYFYYCRKWRYLCSYYCYFVDFCRNTGVVYRRSYGFGCKVPCNPGPFNPICPRFGRRVY